MLSEAELIIKTLEILSNPKIISIKPPSKKLKIQVNLQMPFLTGIADAIFINEDDEVNIW